MQPNNQPPVQTPPPNPAMTPTPDPVVTPQPNANWAYQQENQPQQDTQSAPEPQAHEPVSWTASEFIAHHKSAGWYTTVVASFAAVCLVIYLVTGDIVSVVAISIVVGLFLVVSSKKPRQQAYSVSNEGISVGQKFYPYADFKSFSLVHEGAVGYVSLMPLKRLMPEISIYFAPEDEARIIDVLAENLPNDQRGDKGLDRVMKQLRF